LHYTSLIKGDCILFSIIYVDTLFLRIGLLLGTFTFLDCRRYLFTYILHYTILYIIFLSLFVFQYWIDCISRDHYCIRIFTDVVLCLTIQPSSKCCMILNCSDVIFFIFVPTCYLLFMKRYLFFNDCFNLFMRALFF